MNANRYGNRLSKTIAVSFFMLTLTGCYRPIYYPNNSGYGGQAPNYGGYPNSGYGSNYPNAQYPQGQYGYGNRQGYQGQYGNDGDDYRGRRRAWRQNRDDD